MGAKSIIIFIIGAILDVFTLLIIVRAVLSFFALRGGAAYRIYNLLGIVTEPVLSPIRRLLQRIPGLSGLPIDFSPVVVVLLISLIRALIR